MRWGLIAFAESSGLGNQSHQLYEHLKPTKVMLLDRTGSKEFAFYPERYDNQAVIVKSLPEMTEVDHFIDGLDLVVMIEATPTNYLIYACRQRGVKTIIIPNFEYYHYFRSPNLLHPDALIAPSLWRMDEYLDPVAYVPFPVEPQPHKMMPELATNFLHVAGRPIHPDRNGTEILLAALKHVQSTITVTITCQDPQHLSGIARGATVPDNVKLDLRTNDIRDWHDIYTNQHALIMPRRFGGLCMPVNEALGFGLPVIMPDIEPNNKWLPGSWLVPAVRTEERTMSTTIDIFSADAPAVAALIDKWADDTTAYSTAAQQAQTLAQNYSWEALAPKYMRIFEQVCYHEQ